MTDSKPSILPAADHAASAPSLVLYGFRLPPELSAFVKPIERSRAMLALPDDWDGEGSLRYDEATWRRAVGLVIDTAAQFCDDHQRVPPSPMIGKGPDGSIDLLWRTARRKLLINVPADAVEAVTSFGNDRARPRRVTEGTLDLSEHNASLLVWLTE